MVACLLVILFFTVVLTGPAGVEFLQNRRALLDRPTARVTYLPGACCRAPMEIP